MGIFDHINQEPIDASGPFTAEEFAKVRREVEAETSPRWTMPRQWITEEEARAMFGKPRG